MHKKTAKRKAVFRPKKVKAVPVKKRAEAVIRLRHEKTFAFLHRKLFVEKGLHSLLNKYVSMPAGKERNALKLEIKRLLLNVMPFKIKENRMQLQLFFEFLTHKFSELKRTNSVREIAAMQALMDIFCECFNFRGLKQ
jgi:hypothetical protein